MDKRSKRILWAFGVAVLSIIIIEIVRPKPIDWSPSYTASDKIPFGCYIVYNEIEDLFGNDTSIEQIIKDPFEFLRDSTYQQNSAYLFVNPYINFDKRQYQKLSNYVKMGNTAFLSGRNFGNILYDSLGVDTQSDYNILEKEIEATFFNPKLRKDSLSSFKKGVYKSVFKEFDTTKTTVLGYYKSDEKKLDEVNFIKVQHGKGYFYFHSLPEAFTNYYLLKGNQEYTAKALSYLDSSEIYWDDYLKSGRKVVDSPMRFVLNQVSLRWAYYISIIGIILFVIYRGKREQRIIKVVEPLENSSIEFTRTIGDLHFQYKDYGNIIAKKITYFLEKVRSQYYLDTNKLNDDFCKKLAQKSGYHYEDTKKLIELIKNLKGKSFHNEQDLIKFNKLIEEFST